MDRHYFYTDGTSSFGPFTLEALKEQHIGRETLVWCQGMPEWARAETVPELAELFELIPPRIKPEPAPQPQPAPQPSQQRRQPPKSWLVESILATLFCCWPFGIPAIVNAARVESRFYRGDLEGSEQASAKAKQWTLTCFWVGIGCYVLYILLYVILIATGVWASWELNEYNFNV